jgi:MFS family permease
MMLTTGRTRTRAAARASATTTSASTTARTTTATPATTNPATTNTATTTSAAPGSAGARVRRGSAPRPTLFTPAFSMLALASLAYFTGAGILIPALPRYVEGPLGGGNVAVGLTFGAFSVSAVLLRPWAGRVGDRRGRRPLMLLGAAIFAVSVLGYELASTPALLASLRLLSGAGEACFFVGMATAFADLAPPERRGEAMSLASLALYLGIGLGPVLSEVALARSGFTAAWLLAAAAALAAVALVTRVPETRVAEPEAPEPPRRLVHPAGLLPGVVLFASIVGMAGFLAFVPLHVLDIGMTSAGSALLLFAVTVVAIRSFGARLPDLLGPATAIRAALVLSAAGLVLVGLWHDAAGLHLGAVVFGTGIALLTPSVFALAVAGVRANERAQVMGTTSAFIDLAFGLGPVAMGFVAGVFGRPAAFLTGAAVAVAGLVLVVWAKVGR